MRGNERRSGAPANDFRSVLDALLGAYRPFLERELERSRSADKLEEEERKFPNNCDEEIEIASQLFDRFFTEKVAYELLPAVGREVLGPVDSWIWCYRQIRCCMFFGWLLCRAPRTFRAFVYYLFRYWICVREVLGNPVSSPPTAEEVKDFGILVRILSRAYSPYLSEQIKDVEYPFNIPAEVANGEIDCNVGSEEMSAVFERLLSPETASILFGRNIDVENPFVIARACRCYCLCAFSFGCCLARSNSLIDVVRCLKAYFACLERCFQPLIAEIDTPTEDQCVSPVFVAVCSHLAGIEIRGTAEGSAFTHYTLGYSWGGPIVNVGVVYPDCTRPPANPTYATAVVGGILGWLDRNMLPPGINEFTVYLDVYGSGGLHLQVIRDFQLQTQAVEITAAGTVQAMVAEDPFHAGSFPKLIKAMNDPSTATPEQSIGGSVSVTGSAYTIGCDRQMTQYVLTLLDAPPASPVPSFPNATGGAPLIGPVVYADTPNHPWSSGCFLTSTPNTIMNGDLVAVWSSINCIFPPPTYSVPKISSNLKWGSNPSGRKVILLEVRDRLLPLGTYPGDVAGVDQVAVWIDNQTPIAQLHSIGGVVGCGDLHLKDYVGTTAEIVGIAWDWPIDASAPQQAPNDNFGSYSLSFQKNGGGGGVIPGATPNTRVPNVWPAPPAVGGTLANWDITNPTTGLDGGPGPTPTNPWQIIRGQRCAYVVVLGVTDTTWVGDGGSHNTAGPILYAINVINDIGT